MYSRFSSLSTVEAIDYLLCLLSRVGRIHGSGHPRFEAITLAVLVLDGDDITRAL